MTKITTKTVNSAKPSSSAYFIRDDELKGFALRVFPSGAIKYLAEVWHDGKSHRKTLGTHPVLDLKEARQQALSYIRDVQSGQREETQKAQITLEALFHQYVRGGRLKPDTITNYRYTVFFYLKDWLDKPVNSITKEMVENRYYLIRDEGISGGKPTYSQAALLMRILSAMMNYARADETIETNPVEVLKLKRIDRTTRKRESYLTAEEVQVLLRETEGDTRSVVLAIKLMLFTGLRKNEALRLQWDDIETVNGVSCLLIRDTKNHRPHYLPVTPSIQGVLELARNSSRYVFPSQFKKDCYVRDERPTLRRLSAKIGLTFQCHDLRRTFATRAMEVGVDYLMVKRLLNHKSNDITARYIQWNSKANLEAMRGALEKVRY